MGVVLVIVNDKLSGTWTAELVPMMAGVPIVAVTTRSEDYRSFLSGEIDDRTYAKTLAIRTNPGSLPARPKRNRSYRRFDLSVGPTFAVQFGQLDDAVRGNLNIVPQVETALARGILLTGQLVIPIVEEIESASSGVRPGRITGDLLRRRGPLVGVFRAGLFDAERYGFSLVAGGWTWQDRFLISAQGDLTGKLALRDGEWEYSDLSVFTYALAAQYWYPLLDVTLRASFVRFLGEEHGVRIDLNRLFGELEIGFFGIQTESESIGGFLVYLPLPLPRYPRPRAVRLKTVPGLTWEYRAEVSRHGRMLGAGLSVTKLYKDLAPSFIRNNVSEWIGAQRMMR
jgi:hypothetical protein